MPQPNDLSRSLVALDQNSTIIAVVELSHSSWLLGALFRALSVSRARSWSRAQNEATALTIYGTVGIGIATAFLANGAIGSTGSGPGHRRS